MQFSRDWLAEYVELPESTEELARRLTAAGLAVEGLEEVDGDLLLDVDVTTNRPDCMNHLGLAREVAVLFQRPLRRPSSEVKTAGEPIEESVEVRIDDPDCWRYAARLVRGVRVGPSPDWLQRRLRAIGQRPINNIVDVTNFVLWETGQPIHAFDLDRLAQARVVVRAARPDEELTTLDGERRKLSPEVLVIADAERAVALAGIMGGLDSEVTENTTDVLVESAHFDRRRTRRGAGVLDMHTDASHRFERGADPGICREAADRVARLLVEVAGGEAAPGALDVHATQPPRLEGTLDCGRLSRFAGLEFEPAEVKSTLDALGFGVRRAGDGRLAVEVPSWRLYDFIDCREDGAVWEADLFEEVMRIRGFDPIPSALPAIGEPDEGSSTEHELRQRIRRYLAACGLAEAINYSFHDRAAESEYPALSREGGPVRIANPLSEALAILRRSLLPGLVESARFNQRRGAEAVRLFEIGRVFPGVSAEELEVVAVVAGGGESAPWLRRSPVDQFTVKGFVDGLAAAFGVTLESVPAERRGLLAGTACNLETAGEVVGYLGRLDDDDFPFPVFAAELTTAVLGRAGRSSPVRLPSRHPAVAVDLTLTHALDVPWRRIEEEIWGAETPDLLQFGLKDRYSGKGVPEGAVNTTIFFLYNAEDRSLTQEEVNEVHHGLSELLRRRFGWSD